MTPSDDRPDISVVLIAPAGYPSLRRTLRSLRAQTIAGRIEVLIVTPDPATVAPDPIDVDTFHAVRIFGSDRIHNMSDAQTIAIRAARADFVWLAEDHCFPDPPTAEALLARLREGYTIVGPQMDNANPDSTISWVSFVNDYGAFAVPAAGGETDTVPGNNSAYRRDILLSLGDDLPGLLAAETVLHWNLRAAGHRAYLESGATHHHVNYSTLKPFLTSKLFTSRVFAHVWSRQWPWSRRLRFALLSPGIAGRRMFQLIAILGRQSRPETRLSRTLPLFVASSVASSIGYAMGFLFGADRDVQSDWELETNRWRFLSESDRRQFQPLQ